MPKTKIPIDNSVDELDLDLLKMSESVSTPESSSEDEFENITIEKIQNIAAKIVSALFVSCFVMLIAVTFISKITPLNSETVHYFYTIRILGETSTNMLVVLFVPLFIILLGDYKLNSKESSTGT